VLLPRLLPRCTMLSRGATLCKLQSCRGILLATNRWQLLCVRTCLAVAMYVLHPSRQAVAADAAAAAHSTTIYSKLMAKVMNSVTSCLVIPVCHILWPLSWPERQLLKLLFFI